MFLFIFESIGTSELLLIGLVALIFLGPRKMPEIARKIGKVMSEFRGTANEFKETWQREVDFSEEAKLLDVNAIAADTIPRGNDTAAEEKNEQVSIEAPAIKEIDPADFEKLRQTETLSETAAETKTESQEINDKKNWF